MRLKKLYLLLAAALAFPSIKAAEPIPYYNPCEDINTITWVRDVGGYGTSDWAVYSYGTGTSANPAFSYVPGYRGNYEYSLGSTVFTKELDIKDGKVYKMSLVYGSWYTATAVRQYVKFNVALYKEPKYEYKDDPNLFTEVFVKEQGDAFNSSTRPSYTFFFKGDSSRPYVGIGNRGSGNVTRVGLDDIRIVEVDALTPDVVTGLTGTVDGKDVALNFTLPKTNVVGDALSNIETVKLLRDGTVIKEWNNQTPGAALSFTDNVTSSSDYKYSVVCGNNGSDGEAVLITVTVPIGTGFSTPTQNTDYGSDTSKVNGYYGRNYNAHAIYVPGEGIKVKYAYPLSAYYEGQIPEGEDKVIGTVTRLNDDKNLATESEDGEVLDTDIDHSLRNTYQYKVDLQRYTNKKTAYSSIVSINNPMPFFPGISSKALEEFTYFDADGDMNTWSVITSGDTKYHAVTTWFAGGNSTKYNGDDWLITPGLKVEKGKSYRVDADALCTNLIETPLQFMMAAGRSNTAEAMTDTIMPLTKLKHLTPERYSGYYTAEEDGNVFFGFRTYESSGGLGLSRIYIDEVSSDLPVAIDLINVAYSATPGNATISFNAPTKNIIGGDLTALTKIELYKNGEIFKTYENPAPGAEISEDITFSIGSQDVYMTIPYTEGGAGLKTQASVMVLEPPYENTFDSESDMTGFTVIDPEESGYTWSYMALNKAARSYPDRATGQDDFLITPPIHLEKGQFYRIDFTTWLGAEDTNFYYDNQLEVLLGTAPTREALTTTVHEPFYVRGGFNSKAAVKEWFTVPETGEYYLAWHSMAAPGLGQEIYLDNVMISDKIPGTYPGPVTNYVVAPDSEGELQVNISYNIPTNDMLGNPLTGKVYYTRLFRDGVQIDYKMNQDPGTAITFTDRNPTQGIHLYTVTCYGGTSTSNMVGTRDMDELVYVGINRPGRVEYVEAVENPDNYGEVTISWGKPTADIDGFPLNTSNITYTVGRYIVNNTTGEASEVVYEQDFVPGDDGKLEYTKVVTSNAETQEFMRFFVRANTTAGKGTPTVVTRYMAVGTPWSLPYKDSFKNSNAEHNMMMEYPWSGYSVAAWGYNTYNPVTGVQPVDGDRGLLIMEVEFAEHGARIYTSRINLNVEKPVLSFYVYNQSNDDRVDNNQLGVSIREGNGEFVNVATKTIDEWAGGKRGWQKATVDLSAYAGKIVYLGFEGRAQSMRFTHVDKIVVDSPSDVDLALTNITHDKVYVGVDHSIKATVKNNGGKAVENAEVVLNLDGEEFDSKTIASIEPGDETVVVFTNQMNRDAVGAHTYVAEVIAEGDADLIDNKSMERQFTMLDNDFPTVENLVGEKAGELVTLTWEEPILPNEAAEITDDFEQYPSWSTMYTGIGEYTLLDRDGQPVGGFQNIELPNVSYGSKQSFTLWDFTVKDADGNEIFALDETYRAHSGDKCLVSIYIPDYYTWTDDVLISPVLSGKAQTISFYAKAYSDIYGEQFQVGYSMDGNKFEDFKDHMFDKENVGGDWKLFTYELPEGAKYFMIEHYSNGGYFLFVDDLTYTPVGDETLTLKGYNVYREDEKLNSTPVTFAAWVDKEAVKESNNNYGVSAVYDRGESPLASVSVDTTGVDALTAAGIRVTVENQDIVITGAEGQNFSIVNMAGMILTQRKAEGTVRVPVQPGVYVVNINGKVTKVMVN